MVSVADASIKGAGAWVNIEKLNGQSLSGQVVIEINQQSTKPFIKKHHRNVTFPSDTNISSGDIFSRQNQNYIVVELSDNYEFNTIASKEGIAYKCNYSGEIIKFVTSNTQLGVTATPTTIHQNVNGVLAKFSEIQVNNDPIQYETGIWGLYMPMSVSGEINDRVVWGSGEIDRYESFRIKTIDKGIESDGVKFVTLDNDTR